MSWEALEAVFAGRPHVEDGAAAFRAQFTDEEWAFLVELPEVMAAYRGAFTIGRERSAGRVPSHYTGSTVCRSCGPVAIWAGAPAEVLGCPWCLSRAGGAP